MPSLTLEYARAYRQKNKAKLNKYHRQYMRDYRWFKKHGKLETRYKYVRPQDSK